MFEKLVERLLNKFLGQYVEDFKSDNLSIGLWSGAVEIKNVQLKKEIIKKLNLPFKLKYSKLGCLKMNIPWSSLASSKIDVIVQGLELIISEIPEKDWQCKNNKIIEQRKKQIQSFCDAIAADFAKKSEQAKKQDEQEGYFGKMVVKIIDNIQVTVKNIHVRFEDEITKKYSFGFTLEELNIYTVNKNGEPQFIDRTKKQYENEPLRKKLILSEFGVYWNQSSDFFQSDVADKMYQSIARKDKSNKLKMNYLILMSSKAMLYQRQAGKQFIQPQINLKIGFQQLKIAITNQQLQQLVTMSERLQKYSNEVKSQNRKKLTQLQMIANRQLFLQLFPRYYQKTISNDDLMKIQHILEKMEIANFQQGIKSYLMKEQKEKMIKDKREKSRGWFSGPKELTDKEQEQIEKFLNQNFAKEVIVVKRPEDFHYIRVDFSLDKLEIVIANQNKTSGVREGIRSVLTDIQMNFSLRERGYMLDFAIDGIKVDLFRKIHSQVEMEEETNIVKKMADQICENSNKKYITLKVIGNPLDKKHLDTEIILWTEELLVLFDPQLIKVATDFANIKVNAKNTQAAFEAYGDLKNYASETANQSLKNTQKKKSFISIDVNISAINVVLYFDPKNKQSHIWAMSLGNIQIYTDPEILKKPQFNYDEPMEKYCMKFVDISLVHFQTKKSFFMYKAKNLQISPKSRLLNDLTVGFEVQIFQQGTDQVPKIRGRALMGDVGLNICDFTFGAVQKIGQCFAVPEQIHIEAVKEKQKAIEKSEVMKQAKKIGILYEQNKDDDAKKYIAVLSGSYLYMYENKKDNQYSQYYYVKNAKFNILTETLPAQKQFAMQVENSVNKVTLGFQKQQLLEDWMKAIKNLDDSDYDALIKNEPEMKKKATSAKVSPNLLNFEVHAELKSVSINTILKSGNTITISIEYLATVAKLHQAKNVLNVSLKSITLKDNIYQYKYRELDNFLYSSGFQGQDKLIDIGIEQLTTQHPDYKLVDMSIDVNFGKLTCNYKPETVEGLMLFFLPPQAQKKVQPQPQQTQSTIQGNMKDKQLEEKQKKRRTALLIVCDILRSQPQKFGMKVNVNIQEISVALVNRKNRVMFGKMGLNNFKLLFGQSNRRMVLQGSLEEMWYADYSKYPYTIYQEQEDYTHRDYIMSSYKHSRDMLVFDIQMLEIPNSKKKTMLINTTLNDLKVSYVQQPVLRILTYLTEQMLPSLTPSADPDKPKQTPKNDTKPEESPMDLQVHIDNILVLVEPRSGMDEYLQLNVQKLFVKNQVFYRDYIKNPLNSSEKVLVENYCVNMKGIRILQKFRGEQTKLTNDLDFDVSCDLIANSPYYHKTFGNRFQPGMRIDCKMTPFVMRINHDDYNFMMKCLNWNVSYDDNAEGYMFNGPQKPAQNAPPADPFYMNIFMEQIALCVTEQGFPLNVMLLNKMDFGFSMGEAGMEILLTIKNIFATYITKVNEEESIQRGMFNAFGFEQKINTRQLYEMDKLVDIFSRKQMVYADKQKPVISFEMKMGKSGDLIIFLNIDAMKIDIELKNLLILSKLAIMEQYIQPPKSTIKPINKPEPPVQANAGKMQIVLQMDDFLGSLSDKKVENYIVMEGAFLVKLLMLPNKPDDQIIQQAMAIKKNRFRQLASHIIEVKKFSFYFCNKQDLKDKRFILMPISLYTVFKQYYGVVENTVFLETEIEGNLDKIIVEASVRDMLMINKIVQDNLQTMAEVNQADQRSKSSIKDTDRSSVKTDISGLIEQTSLDKDAIEKTVKKVEKKIKDKMKAKFSMQPMQIRIINDCDNNFMPVINFVMQESKVLYVQDPIKGHLSQAVTVKLDFFNPRSSTWEPVMETFQLSIDLLNLNTEFGPQTKIMVTSSQIEDFKQLRFNVSTQLLASMFATLQIANQQKKQIARKRNVKEIQVSPYIVQNMTNKQISILRKINGKQSIFKLDPLFNGPLKLGDNATSIKFIWKEKEYDVSLEQYGVIRVPKVQAMHLNFRINKLNRIISFVGPIVIRNLTQSQLYCIRYNESQERIDKEEVLVDINQMIPMEKFWFIQFSFNKKTYTQMAQPSNLQELTFLKAQSSKFKLSITGKTTVCGHQTFNLRTPLIISNCLPKDIKVQFIKQGKTVSTKQIPAHTSHEVFANEQVVDLRYKVIVDGFYWSHEFGANPAKFGEECHMFLNDRQKGGTTLKYIFQKVPRKNQVIFNIFCSAYLVSELDYNVEIYGNLDKDEKNQAIEKYYKLGGQSQYWKQEGAEQKVQSRQIDKITLIGAETGSKVRICGQNCLVDFSQPVIISGLGVNQSRIVVEKETNGKKISVFTMIGVEIELTKMALGSDIISRKITLRSRSIVFNNSIYDLSIREDGCQYSMFNINSKEKKPFYFSAPELKQKPRSLIIKSPSFRDSIPIMSNGLGVIYFRLELLDSPGSFVYFKMNIQEIKSYIYYQIKTVEMKELPYQVIVKSPNLQAYIPQFNKVVTKNSQPLLFINQLPHQPFNMRMQVRAVGTQRFDQFTVQVDNLNYKKKMKFYEEGVTKMYIPAIVYIIFNDSKKFIVVDEMHKQSQEDVPEYDTQTINLRLEKISLSLISNHGEVDRPYESFYFYMYNLEFIMDKTNKATRYQTKLQFLQFDQSEPFNLSNPVIMTPTKYKQFTSKDPKDKPKSIFNSLVEIDNSFVKNMFLNKVVVEMNDLVFHATTQFLKIVMQVYKEFMDVMNKQNDYKTIVQINTWEKLEPPQEGSKTFIKTIIIAPFTIQISASLRLNELDNESMVFFGTIVNALGVVITNIQGAPIVFDGVSINDCVDTVQGINQKLMEHYKSSVMRQLYKVFGSLNILGNPVSLFRNISTGFKDLKDKPAEGFVEGPLQFGKGLAQGTSSLIAHSVGGALNSVSKVTGAVGSGLAALTFDKEFEQAREKQKMKKPKHVFDGLQKGGKAVFHGFKEGITGLFTQPYQNTKKEGVVGFFKGAAKGVTGLVVKPVTGVVDFASKTTQGLKNTALYLEDRPNQNRIRYPRVFYSDSAIIKQYNSVDSKLFAIISKTKYEQKYGFENTQFMDSFVMTDREFLLVLKEDIIGVTIDDEKIEWAVPIEDSKVKSTEKGLVIQSKHKRQWYTKKVNEVVKLQSKEDEKLFLKLVEELKISIMERKNKMEED